MNPINSEETADADPNICASANATAEPVNAPNLAVEETATSGASTTGDQPEAPAQLEELVPFGQYPVAYREARIDHFLCRDGTVRRHCVLTSRRLRDLLGKPRREPIDPMELKRPEGRWRLSDLWEEAERTAMPFLKGLYARAAELEPAHTPAAPAKTPSRNAVVSRAAPTGMESVPHQGESRGKLMGWGLHPELGFFLDVYGTTPDDDRPRVLRYNQPSLAEALETSKAQEGEVVHVIPLGEHTVTIQQHSRGSLGKGDRQFKRSMPVYQIERESAGAVRVQIEPRKLPRERVVESEDPSKGLRE